MAEHVASFMCCTNSVNSALAPISNQSPSLLQKQFPRLNISRRSLIGSPAWTALKDVGNLLVNDDQAEEAARRMSVYPIKGGLGDKDAPTTPYKSPFELGAHLNLSVPPLAPQQKCCPRRVSVIFKRITSSFRTKTCVLLSFFIPSFCQSLQHAPW